MQKPRTNKIKLHSFIQGSNPRASRASLSPLEGFYKRIPWLNQEKLVWLALASFTLGAFLMRRKGLATQSLWFDEADLISRASQRLPTLLGGFIKPGENGPLYTLFMHFWILLVGKGEAAIRTPSMLAGTLAVPLIFLVGKRLVNLKLGLMGAFLLAISPYQLWYSQDAKMYPLALCITLASVFFFLKALESGENKWWVFFVLITTLGFYVHLMTVLIVGVEVLYFFLVFRPKLKFLSRSAPGNPSESPARLKRQALISLGLLTLPYLPIALWQLIALKDGTVGVSWFKPVGLLEMLNTLGRRFGMNRSIEPWESLGAGLFAILAGLGLWAAWRRRKPGRELGGNLSHPALFLTIYLLLPVLAFYLLTTRIPLFADRYLLIASPAYYLLAGWGLLWLLGKAAPVGLVALALGIILALVAITSYNYSKEPQKEDWRGAMAWLEERVRPGDEIFVIPGYLDSAVKYYFKPPFEVPIFTIPGDLLDDHDDSQLNDFLQKSIRGNERAWLVVSPERYKQEEPKEFVRTGWFDFNTRMFNDPQEKVGVKIYGYSYKLIPGTNAEFFPRTLKTSFKFGDGFELDGFDYSQKPTVPTGTVKANEFLHLTLYWRKLNLDKTSYAFSVRLLDQTGRDTGTNYASLPLNGYYPTDRWRINEAVRDYRDIFIKVPPGEYNLEISVFPVKNPEAALMVTGEGQGKIPEGATSLWLGKPVIVLPPAG